MQSLIYLGCEEIKYEQKTISDIVKVLSDYELFKNHNVDKVKKPQLSTKTTLLGNMKEKFLRENHNLTFWFLC